MHPCIFYSRKNESYDFGRKFTLETLVLVSKYFLDHHMHCTLEHHYSRTSEHIHQCCNCCTAAVQCATSDYVQLYTITTAICTDVHRYNLSTKLFPAVNQYKVLMYCLWCLNYTPVSQEWLEVVTRL